ncbi:amino acid ABC transporter permease [Oscillospiraceae bacterium PP1C4]
MLFFKLIVSTFPNFIAGLGITIKITLISLVIATVLGLISCMFQISRSKILNFISQIYIDLIRGTPVLVQVFFIYFGLTKAMGIRMTADTAGIITLSLNAGAYLSEIFRGGIQAINIGQMEAARSLGLPYGRAMSKVILPQAVRVVIPSMVNQFIITLKDTSIISVVGLRELTQTGKLIVAVNFESFRIWAIVALYYLVIITILSKLSKMLERRISYGKGKC